MLESRKYTTFDLVRLAFKVAPGLAFILLIQRLLGALMPALLVLATANFIDTALAILNNEMAFSALYLPMALLGGVVAYQWAMGDVRKYLDSRMLIKTRLTYRVELMEKRARLDYRYIEDQDTYDLIKRVTDPSETQVMNQYHDMIGLLDIIIQVVSLMMILMVNVWWAGIAILLFSIPAFYLGIKAGKMNYEADREMSKVERKAFYLSEICSGRDPALERTLFGYSSKITAMLWERFEFSRKYKQKVERKYFIRMKMGGILTSLISGFVMIVLLQPVASGTITIGLYMSLINACANLTFILSWGLSYQLSQLAKNREYLDDLTKFYQLEEQKDALVNRSQEVPTFESLEFRGVSFTYPGTKKRILNHVSFTIKPGKHYAFVGVNGAGKTTVIKLLTGQYQDYEGKILINGRDIKEYPMPEFKAFFSVAYQDFARYSLSVKENILIGNQNNQDDLTEVMADLELDTMAANLPNGIDTTLGKIKEDGIDLSGGQWQRIALARTVISPAPIKILDEPTAALDPLSESRLYHQFEKIIEGQTSIFISHRLGSIKLADEIFVFDGGTITELGSHTALMEQEGKYFAMYSSQLSWYHQEEVVTHESH